MKSPENHAAESRQSHANYMRPVACAAAILFIFVWSASAQFQAQPEQVSPEAAGRYIVIFQPGTPPAARVSSVRRAGASVRFNYEVVDAVAVGLAGADALAAMRQDRSVSAIIPDRVMHAIQNPIIDERQVQPFASSQTIPAGVRRVGRPTSTSNGSGIGVAIIDTGIDFAHRDLAPSSQSFSAVVGTSCQDDNGHGTHVSGIVAALNNTVDVVGVAPNAKLYCVKVLDRLGAGSDSQVMAGLDWVFTNHSLVSPGIRVVNMSLGRPGSLNDNPALRASIQQLYNAGIVVVVAAGNDPGSEVSQMVPATYPEVFAVASTTALGGTNSCFFLQGSIHADTASYFTTDGKFDPATRIGVTISVPGEDRENVNVACVVNSVGILSTRLGGGTTRLSGTSMASPHVAGIVARLMQSGAAGPENIRGIIRANADRKSIAPLDSPTAAYTFDGEREGVGKVQ
ncbi:MAG TPA: S8 family serine peptidase [Terriglobia bacterium]|nr:S8 family serine peptidase [Terriglobia bacterium]